MCKSFYGIDVIDLEVVAAMKFDKAVVKTLGECVVEGLTNTNEFLIMWREHFLDKMQPKCMPKFWDVNRSTR